MEIVPTLLADKAGPGIVGHGGDKISERGDAVNRTREDTGF
jgi:hypothetical protein